MNKSYNFLDFIKNLFVNLKSKIMPEDIESVLFGDRNERLNKALKIYGKTRKDLEQDLLILNEWLKSQRHLPDICCKYI